MSDDAAAQALEQRFAERLLEDESLRADLTDDEFSPLQSWALARLHERAAALADPAAPEAETELESLLECLRAVLRAANDTLGHRFNLDAQAFSDGLMGIYDALEPPLYAAEGPANNAQLALEAVIPRLAARKDEADGVELVDALVAALTGSASTPADESGSDGERA
jgi:hypothetical protein